MSISRKKKLCKGACNSMKFLFSGGKCEDCWKLENYSPPNRKSQYAIPTSKKPIKKQTEKNKKKRSEQRKNFPEFFEKHINIIKEKGRCCDNCGDKLQGIAAEVAHLVSKNQNGNPEVATNDNNVIYLCFFGNSCHAKFDSSFSARESMNCFSLAREKIKSIKHLIIRQTNEYLHLIGE